MRRRLLPPVALALVALSAFGAAAAAAAPLDRLVARGLARAGGANGGFVLDTTTGRTLAAVRADARRIPASVEKLYTASTALLRFGPRGTLDTTVLATGELDDAGVLRGSLFLRGGGDPTFGSYAFTRRAYGLGATIETLAVRVRNAGIRRVTGRVYGDESWLDGLRGGPSSGFRFDPYVGGPLGGLMFNRGLARENGSAIQTKPAKFAAQQLTLELRRAGVRVGRGAGERSAPAAAEKVASVSSPTMGTLIRLTLVPSDNLVAEMLLKSVGAAHGPGGSTAAGGAVVRRTLRRYGVRPRIADGSGLSRANATTPRQVVTLLDAMRNDVTFRAALPVAGRSGTLATRMRGTLAQDRCQAKTGTLSNVSALAGYCRTRNDHVIAFAFLSNEVSPYTAKAAEDRLLAALARTRPGGRPRPVPVATRPTGEPEPTPAPTTGGGASPAVD